MVNDDPSPADPHANTVDSVLRRSAARWGDRIALRFADRTWTYAELDRAVDAVAARLRDLPTRPGDRVAALGKNSDAYVVAFLACSRAGRLSATPPSMRANSATRCSPSTTVTSDWVTAPPVCLCTIR